MTVALRTPIKILPTKSL